MDGQDLTFQVQQVSDEGSFALTGQDVAFSLATIMTAEEGSFVSSGQDVTFRVSMGTSHGTFQANGQDANFRISVSAGEGSFALTGQTIQTIISLIASHGSFTVTGQNADLSAPDPEPAFDVDFVLASIKNDDQGLHLLESDEGLYISSDDLARLNLTLRDLGLYVAHASVRLNVRGG